MAFIVDREILEKNFPYNRWREGQYELAQQVVKSINEREILLAAYPIGHGKTAASLAGALASEARHILYLVRTKTQFQAPLREIKRLNRKLEEPVKTVVLRSRQDYCPLKFSKQVDYNEFTVICSKLRSEGTCPYSTGTTLPSQPDIEIIDVSSSRKISRTYKVCPYEVALNALKYSRIIILPYIYVFSSKLRKNILQKYGVNLEDSVLILDEAHNLPESISDIGSATLTISLLNEIKREIRSIKNIPNIENVYNKISLLISLLKRNIASETEVNVETLYSMFPSKEELIKIASYIELQSTYYVSKTRKLAEIVEKTETYRDSLLVTLKPIGGENILTITLFDPSKVAAQVFSSIRSAVLLSATMPPKEYLREMLGLAPRKIREVVYPYLWSKNAKIYIVKGLTSQFSSRTEKMYKKYGAAITLLAAKQGITLVIAPSYNFLYSIYSYTRVNNVLLEKKSIDLGKVKEKVYDALEREGYIVVLATAWGKLVEGIEFVRNGRSQVSTIIIAGIPLPEPTLKSKKMLEKLSIKLGSSSEAWNLVYTMPAAYKIVQAIGRGLRSRYDKVTVYILDERGEKLLSSYLLKYGFEPVVVPLKTLIKNLGYT